MTGTGAGLTRHFFYPGFTPATGGLLREPDLLARQARFDKVAWLKALGIDFRGQRLVSLFCYEPPALGDWLDYLANDTTPTVMVATPGRAATALQTCIQIKNRLQPTWNIRKMLSFLNLPPLPQAEFDHLLWACDLNFVRGEDSLVRALWANKPFIWQIYSQHDDAHHSKLQAFLDMMNAPPSLRTSHFVWNGVTTFQGAHLPVLGQESLLQWQQTVTQVRNRLLAQDDLVSQIMRFALKNH